MEPRPIRLPALDELAALVAAVEEGSLAAAARRLYLTRPAVAKRIGNLETLVGDRLLERSEQGVRPTAAGRAVFARATRLLGDATALVAHNDGSLNIAGVHRLLGRPAAAPRAEQLLHETETLFAQVFHTSPDAIVISLLADGTIVEANDAFCTLAGIARSELHGRTSLDLGLWVDPDQRSLLADQLRSEETIRGDMQLRRRDGPIVDIAYVAHLLPLQADDVLLIRLEDVTARRRAERAEAVRGRRHRRLSSFGVRVMSGADPDEFAADAVRFLAAELDADVAVVLRDAPIGVHACGNGAAVARLVHELGIPEGPHPLVLAEPLVFAAQRIDRASDDPLVLAAAAADPEPFGQDDVALLAAIASMTGVAYALAARGWPQEASAASTSAP